VFVFVVGDTFVFNGIIIKKRNGGCNKLVAVITIDSSGGQEPKLLPSSSDIYVRQGSVSTYLFPVERPGDIDWWIRRRCCAVPPDGVTHL
jgi:hypothetical protein